MALKTHKNGKYLLENNQLMYKMVLLPDTIVDQLFSLNWLELVKNWYFGTIEGK